MCSKTNPKDFTPEQTKVVQAFNKLIESKLQPDCLICKSSSDLSTEAFVSGYVLGFMVGVGSEKVDMPLCETHNLELVQAYVSMLTNDLPAPSQKKCCGGCKKGKNENE